MNHILQYQINLDNGSFGRAMNDAAGQTGRLDSMVRNLGATIAGAFAFDRMKDFAGETVNLASKMQGLHNIVKFANAKDEAKNLAFISNAIHDMKLPMVETTEGYAKFLGGVKDTAMEGEAANKVFQSLAEATTVLHLPAETSASIFLALQQMVGKTKIQAQELTIQLGQALPGAIGIMARSLKMSIPELYKQMEAGKLMSVDVLPKFAAEMHKVYGPSVQNALHSIQARLNDVSNAAVQQKNIIGEKLAPAWISLQEAGVKGLTLITRAITFLEQHKAIAVGIGAVAIAFGGLTLAVMASEKATTLFTTAMEKNPAGMILVGIGALAAELRYLGSRYHETHDKVDKMSDTMRKSQADFNSEINILKVVNTENSERKNIIDQINTKYGEYLPNLLTEKSSLDEIAKAQNLANNEFERRIFLQSKEESLKPLFERFTQAQKEFDKAQVEYDKATLNTSDVNQDIAVNGTANRLIGLGSILRGAKGAYEKESSLWDTTAKRMGIKPGAKMEATTTNNQPVSNSHSVRNVLVTINGGLVKELKMIMGSDLKEGSKGVSDLKNQITQLLVGVVRDSEIALS